MLLFAVTGSFAQSSCQPAAENSALVFLPFSTSADEAPQLSCSKKGADTAVKAVKAEAAANTPALDCNPQKCEPCPLGCCEGFPDCRKAKAASLKKACSGPAEAALAARQSP